MPSNRRNLQLSWQRRTLPRGAQECLFQCIFQSCRNTCWLSKCTSLSVLRGAVWSACNHLIPRTISYTAQEYLQYRQHEPSGSGQTHRPTDEEEAQPISPEACKLKSHEQKKQWNNAIVSIFPGKTRGCRRHCRAVKSARALSCHTSGVRHGVQRLSLPAQHPPHRR